MDQAEIERRQIIHETTALREQTAAYGELMRG
jgi:hypothetical protein